MKIALNWVFPPNLTAIEANQGCGWKYSNHCWNVVYDGNPTSAASSTERYNNIFLLGGCEVATY